MVKKKATKKKFSKKAPKARYAREIHASSSSWLSPAVFPWVILSVVLVVAGVLLVPTKTVSYTVETPYLFTETYTVEVPFEDIEEYTVQVPYETSESYVETIPTEITEDINFNEEFLGCQYSGSVNLRVTNLDTEAAEFIIKIGYQWTGASTENVDIVPRTIQPLDSYIFTYSLLPPSGDITCIAHVTNNPTKTRIEQEQVVKQKTVTQYRDETKYRKVTKTRTEEREREVQKIRVETRYKEVNWLFDFDALIKFNKNLPEPEIISEG